MKSNHPDNFIISEGASKLVLYNLFFRCVAIKFCPEDPPLHFFTRNAGQNQGASGPCIKEALLIRVEWISQINFTDGQTFNIVIDDIRLPVVTRIHPVSLQINYVGSNPDQGNVIITKQLKNLFVVRAPGTENHMSLGAPPEPARVAASSSQEYSHFVCLTTNFSIASADNASNMSFSRMVLAFGAQSGPVSLYNNKYEMMFLGKRQLFINISQLGASGTTTLPISWMNPVSGIIVCDLGNLTFAHQ